MNRETAALRKVRSPGLSGQALKTIAIVSMIIDHTGAGIVKLLPDMWDTTSTVYAVYTVLRLIGRLAFPIYCYLLIEGAAHTRNYAAYTLRMLVFCIISEIPFDLALYGRINEWNHQNVFLTLLMGLLMLKCFDIAVKVSGRIPAILLKILVLTIPPVCLSMITVPKLNTIFELDIPSGIAYPVTALMVFVFIYGTVSQTAKNHGTGTASVLCADLICASVIALAANLIHTDYGAAGILTIALMYLFRKDDNMKVLSGCIVLTALSHPSELVTFTILPFVNRYNHERGRGNKYLFYAVYPVHFLIIYLIAVRLGLRGAAIL